MRRGPSISKPNPEWGTGCAWNNGRDWVQAETQGVRATPVRDVSTPDRVQPFGQSLRLTIRQAQNMSLAEGGKARPTTPERDDPDFRIRLRRPSRHFHGPGGYVPPRGPDGRRTGPGRRR